MSEGTEQQTRLSDDEIDRIAKAMEARFLRHFYLNIGKGVFGLAWRGIVILLLALAAYGEFHNSNHTGSASEIRPGR